MRLVLVLVAVFATECYSLYPSSSDVVDLTPANFDRLVTQSDAVWIVEFYAPWCGHCQQFVPEYSKAATALKGVIKVGAVNVDDHKSLGGQFGVRGFPTVKIFAANKNKPEDYNGPRTAQGLVDSGFDALRNKGDPKDVVELTDSNFDSLVLNSEDMWLVKLGAVDATVHTIKSNQYGVQGYPTIKFFPPGVKDAGSASEYTGGRTGSDIVNWALEKLAENVPAPEIKQILDQETLKEACEQHPLCVVSVLPHILDCQADCRNGYLDILNKMGEKFKKKMWGWIWAEAGVQPELENMLEIGGFGYPAMAVMNTKKMKYSILRGSFSTDGINEFLRDLSFGRGSTAPVKGAALPKINPTERWDGKDGELPPEEEIDLSDVDLEDLDNKNEL
ncbi:Protein disulfide-isomerase A6 [Blattella germanica]|nr:Protein disulfide-isomerase A6 [Blattella germanica]